MTPTRPLLLAALLVATFGASAQQVYKWVDPSGKVRYSDMPQAGWKRVDPATGAAIEGSAAQSLTVEPEEDGEEGAEDGAEGKPPQRAAALTAGEPPSPELKAAECKRRREQLENYQKAIRIVEEGNGGTSREYSETERLKLIERTQRQIKELCN